MFAINFAEMGARDLSFLSCLAYGKFGITAVIRRALAVLQAFIIIRSSMSPSFTSPGAVDWIMKTSSSRTDSPIVTDVSWFEYCTTRTLVRSIPSLEIVRKSCTQVQSFCLCFHLASVVLAHRRSYMNERVEITHTCPQLSEPEEDDYCPSRAS